MTEERVLVWAPGRDGRLTCDFLVERGFGCVLSRSWTDVQAALQQPVGVMLVASELLTPDVVAGLQAHLAAQPAWSDLPIIVVGAPDESTPHPLQSFGNASLLPRPLALPSLVSTLRAALRARRRQYEVRDLLAERDEADARKDEFLAMLAHELRNPLAPLRTGLQVLRLSEDPVVIDRMHHLMARQLANVTRLVDDLLDVSRLTRGVVTLKPRPLDLREAIHQVLEGAAEMMRGKGLTLGRDLPDEPVLVNADAVRLEQMIGNLLANATRFTPPGGRIDVRVERDGGEAVIRVRDTGEGIPADQIGRVFDLFAQTSRPLDRSQGGLGIGLTVVKSLAGMHGGSVTIDSEGEGRGTEAVIRLPLHARPAPSATLPPSNTTTVAASQRIVIIEDNADAAESLAIFLQGLGHDVAVARDGRAGLDTIHRHRPHAVICDIGLPEMDGYEVARRLLAEGDVAPRVLIAVTGYGDVVDRARTRAAGFTHHITKPADPAELARLVGTSDATYA